MDWFFDSLLAVPVDGQSAVSEQEAAHHGVGACIDINTFNARVALEQPQLGH